MTTGPNTLQDQTIGARITEARERAGLSSAQLARRLGVKSRTISAWERGESAPRTNRLLMLSQMLGVSTLWLLEGEDRYAPDEAQPEDLRIKGQLETIRRALADLSARIDDLGALVEERAAEQAEGRDAA